MSYKILILSNEEFLFRGYVVDRSLELQKVVDQQEATPSICIKNKKISHVPISSGSDLAPSDNIPLVGYPQ